MPFKKIVKNLLEFKHTVIDNMFVEGEKLLVDVHPTKSFRNRCGCCGHKGRSTTMAPAKGCGGAWAK